jgi:hypothetical protein
LPVLLVEGLDHEGQRLLRIAQRLLRHHMHIMEGEGYKFIWGGEGGTDTLN